MVFESLVNPIKAEKTPTLMILYGFVMSFISIALSLWMFRDHASLVSVFLTVIGCVPLMYSTLRYEEMKDLSDMSEWSLLKEHSKALKFFLALFFGFTIAFVGSYVVLNMMGSHDLAHSLFQVQTETIQGINGKITDINGAALSRGDAFSRIFFNNLRVLMFCLLFSLFYGAGAIFILTWNASVIGAFIGSFILTNLSRYASLEGLAKASVYFQVIFIGFTRISLHGIPEILAYFVGGLAGGIISVAIIKHDFSTKKFEKIVLDSADLVLISILLLFVAALVEVYITPVVF